MFRFRLLLAIIVAMLTVLHSSAQRPLNEFDPDFDRGYCFHSTVYRDYMAHAHNCYIFDLPQFSSFFSQYAWSNNIKSY